MRGRKFEGASMSLHRYISELLLSCCAVGGKIISFFLLSHWRFSLLPLSLLGSGLDLSSEKIKFFFPFHFVSVLCLHQLVAVAVCVITFPSTCCFICCSLINCISMWCFLPNFWWQQTWWGKCLPHLHSARNEHGLNLGLFSWRWIGSVWIRVRSVHSPWVRLAALWILCPVTTWKCGYISRCRGFYLFTSSPSSRLQT